jgi:hypothetical protein
MHSLADVHDAPLNHPPKAVESSAAVHELPDCASMSGPGETAVEKNAPTATHCAAALHDTPCKAAEALMVGSGGCSSCQLVPFHTAATGARVAGSTQLSPTEVHAAADVHETDSRRV